MTRSAAALAVIFALLAPSACGGESRTVVAAGTTLVDSGVMDELRTAYERAEPGVDLSVVGLATREVLELGRRGAADLLISHAPHAEAAFLAEHPGASARAVFASRFVLAGPRGRVADLEGLTVVEALQHIARESWTFVTRADGSGTFERETALWEAAGISPAGVPWYIETGLGMGPSLQVADQREAFILAELGTFLVSSDVVRLQRVALGGDPALLANPYTAILPEPDDAAARFVDWLVSPPGRAALQAANEKIFGGSVFAAPEA